MATCSGYDLPYVVDYSAANFSGNTPAEACQKNGVAYGNGYFAVLNGGTYCEVGYSGSGDGHNIIHQCDAVATTPDVPASSPATAVTCATACTVTVVHELSLPPLQLDATGGASIASAVLAVWALGWGIRQVIRALNSDGNSTSDESSS